MSEKEIKKQTVRLEKEFYKEISKKLIDKELSFQELVTNLLKDWLESK